VLSDSDTVSKTAAEVMASPENCFTARKVRWACPRIVGTDGGSTRRDRSLSPAVPVVAWGEQGNTVVM